jgi:hypothetical protein
MAVARRIVETSPKANRARRPRLRTLWQPGYRQSTSCLANGSFTWTAESSTPATRVRSPRSLPA